jgi:orotidine-5'-phosphate decarboxylase
MTKLYVALDYPSSQDAWISAIRPLSGLVDGFKVGKELFTAAGPPAIAVARTRGEEVFLDLKFHDIPNTVEKAVRAACDHGVTMVNVHASGGMAMMEAAAKAVEGYDTKVIAVTLLTSIKIPDLHAVGLGAYYAPTEEDLVEALASSAKEAGCHGVVCSAQEAAYVKLNWEDALIVTPAIRPLWSVANDQKRPTTPADAVRAGATHLILGRAVTQPPETIEIIDPSDSVIAAAEKHLGDWLVKDGVFTCEGTPAHAVALIRGEIEGAT